jgi:outer membrane receptor for ferric coprogen and ferric-rhodotorulic acid
VTATTPQVGFVVKPFSASSRFADTSIFVNYSESFTPSGLVQPGTTQVVPPAEGTGREIGLKTAWFGGAVQSTISVFRDDLDNIATPDYSTQGQTGAIVAYHLGGKGRSEGAEAEIIWTPSKALQVSANYTYLPTAKYLAYPGVPQQEGLRFPSTPKEQWNLSARYEFESGLLSGFYLGAWIHGQSWTRGTLGSDWKYDVRIPYLVQADAVCGYAYKDLEVQLNIKNIGDREGYVMSNVLLANPPRSVYLSLKYSL